MTNQFIKLNPLISSRKWEEKIEIPIVNTEKENKVLDKIIHKDNYFILKRINGNLLFNRMRMQYNTNRLKFFISNHIYNTKLEKILRTKIDSFTNED